VKRTSASVFEHEVSGYVPCLTCALFMICAADSSTESQIERWPPLVTSLAALALFALHVAHTMRGYSLSDEPIFSTTGGTHEHEHEHEQRARA
jgi:hypothetical protein